MKTFNNMRKFIISILLSLPAVMTAQQFTEYDRKVLNEGQVLTKADVECASDEIPWDPISPIKLYSIHDEGDETIVTFSHSIYFDSQWVAFGKGIYIEDDKNGDVYKVRGYGGKLTMDRLLIVKGCKGENVLIPLRFPKFKRKVKSITIHNQEHQDDIKPSNRRKEHTPVFASKVKVKDYRNRYTPRKVYE